MSMKKIDEDFRGMAWSIFWLIFQTTGLVVDIYMIFYLIFQGGPVWLAVIFTICGLSSAYFINAEADNIMSRYGDAYLDGFNEAAEVFRGSQITSNCQCATSEDCEETP